MFKRLFLAVTTLCILISCSLCNAWQPPKQWIWFYSDDTSTYYYNANNLERILENGIKKGYIEMLEVPAYEEERFKDYYVINTHIYNCTNRTFKWTSMRIHNKIDGRIEGTRINPSGPYDFPIKAELPEKLLSICNSGTFYPPKPMQH